MRLNGRLRRLERQALQNCPLCHGKGKFVVTYLHENESAPPAQGCVGCGKVMHIVVRYVEEKAIHERGRENIEVRGAPNYGWIAPTTAAT